jgi:hypothetical protein
MKIFATLFFICASIQFGCSRPNQINGEVFIVTAGHESVKLGLVEIRAFEPTQVNQAIDAVKRRIAKLEPIEKQIRTLKTRSWEFHKQILTLSDIELQALKGPKLGDIWRRAQSLRKDCDRLFDDAQWHRMYLDSGTAFFEALPTAMAIAKSDSDGKFTMKLPHSGEIVLCAAADRELLDRTESYYWMVKVTPSTGTAITLSNDNLTTFRSPQSVTHTATKLSAEAKSMEELSTKLGKLENEFHALESDFAAAEQKTGVSP